MTTGRLKDRYATGQTGQTADTYSSFPCVICGSTTHNGYACKEGSPNRITLDPDDEFEKHVIDIVKMNRRKRADYADEDNIYKNFDYVAASTMHRVDALLYADIQVTMKNGRIMNLLGSGKEPDNENLEDTYVDRAVYAILALGIFRRDL